MAMKVETALVGARALDSLPFSQGGSARDAEALARTGCDCFVGYLGCVTPERLALVLAAGMAFMPVTLAGEYSDGAADEIAQLQKLGLPKGCTVWLDLEGLAAWNADIPTLTKKLADWATAIAGAGYMPGLYVGCPQPLSSKQLYSLPFVRYWWGMGRCVDKTGALAEPTCGWCMIQNPHGQKNGMLWRGTGILVDSNTIQCDYWGRLPVWVVAA